MNIWWLLTSLNKILSNNSAMDYLNYRLAINDRNSMGAH